MPTFSAKPTDIKRAWYILDASEVPLGRLATVAAGLLIGKGKPIYTAHIDCGDHVIVINASQLVVTGNKLNTKRYYRHSGHPGSLRQQSLAELKEQRPAEVIIHAVRGMLPVNKLRAQRLARLKVYADASHQHESQGPQAVSLKESKT
ncbi:50S ribosomal protein L13 [Candidatus Saccharibacteria bacterium]|nr:50S ribosomal protein L13 [Candidatus Saccharibacteria bacterium]